MIIRRLILLSLMAPTLARGQRTLVARIGDRVRINAPESGYATIIGEMVAADSQQLRVRVSGVRVAFRVVRAEIEAMDVSIARHRHTGSGMALGLVNGALIGLSAGSKRHPNSGPGQAEPAIGAAPRSALIGGSIGALLGGFVGFCVRTDVWRPVSTAVVPIVPSGPFGSGEASLAFSLRR